MRVRDRNSMEGLFEEDNGIEQLTAFLEEKGFMVAEPKTKNNSSED